LGHSYQVAENPAELFVVVNRNNKSSLKIQTESIQKPMRNYQY